MPSDGVQSGAEPAAPAAYWAAMRKPFAFAVGAVVVLALAVAAVLISRPSAEAVHARGATAQVKTVGEEAKTKTVAGEEDKAEVAAQARALGINPSGPRVVEPQAGEGTSADDAEEEIASSSSKPSKTEKISDDEIREQLAALKKTVALTGKPRVTEDGLAAVPSSAPDMVRSIIAAGNEIALLPYRYGGGHTKDFRDTAYDCSASVSYALAAAGLLKSPLASTGFMEWGEPGPGKWVTIYAHEGHAFMVVAGLRFDTSGQANGGTRWQAAPRSAGGFEVRHPPGL
jgi:cell wall-associated NlpC family hydrolase